MGRDGSEVSAKSPYSPIAAWSMIAVLALLAWSGPHWTLRAFAVLTASLGLLALWRTGPLWIRVRYTWGRRTVRMVRQLRSLATPSPTVKLLHAIGLACGLFSVTATALDYTEAGLRLMRVTEFAWSLAALFDLRRRFGLLARQAWAPAAGKALTITAGATLGCLALAWANHGIHHIIHVDPKYAPESVRLATVLALPIVYGSALMASLAVYALMQLLLFSVLTLVATLVRQFTEPGLPRTWRAFRELWFRMRKGKKPAPGALQRSRWLSLDEISFFARPLSTIMLFAMIGEAGDLLRAALPRLQAHAAPAIVALDYRAGSHCRAEGDAARVAYMEEGWISVARHDGAKWIFTVEQCLEK